MEESCNRKTKQIEEVNRKSSRCLSDKHATHYKELLKVCLNQNVDTFSTDHPVAILDHMFAGNDHDKHLKLCPEINKDWCHYHTGRPHQTTMAYHKYMDRTNKYHKRAYEMVKSKVQKRFDDKLVHALRGAERTNGNENGHNMSALKLNKGTRPGRTKHHKGQIASVVCIKNEGNGTFRLSLLQKLRIKPSKKQFGYCQAMQNKQIEQRKYQNKPEIKHKRNISRMSVKKKNELINKQNRDGVLHKCSTTGRKGGDDVHEKSEDVNNIKRKRRRKKRPRETTCTETTNMNRLNDNYVDYETSPPQKKSKTEAHETEAHETEAHIASNIPFVVQNEMGPQPQFGAQDIHPSFVHEMGPQPQFGTAQDIDMHPYIDIPPLPSFGYEMNQGNKDMNSITNGCELNLPALDFNIN
eukprot:707203_1